MNKLLFVTLLLGILAANTSARKRNFNDEEARMSYVMRQRASIRQLMESMKARRNMDTGSYFPPSYGDSGDLYAPSGDDYQGDNCYFPSRAFLGARSNGDFGCYYPTHSNEGGDRSYYPTYSNEGGDRSYYPSSSDDGGDRSYFPSRAFFGARSYYPSSSDDGGDRSYFPSRAFFGARSHGDSGSYYRSSSHYRDSDFEYRPSSYYGDSGSYYRPSSYYGDSGSYYQPSSYYGDSDSYYQPSSYYGDSGSYYQSSSDDSNSGSSLPSSSDATNSGSSLPTRAFFGARSSFETNDGSFGSNERFPSYTSYSWFNPQTGSSVIETGSNFVSSWGRRHQNLYNKRRNSARRQWHENRRY